MRAESIDLIVKHLSGGMTEDERQLFNKLLEQDRDMYGAQWQVGFITDLMVVTKNFSKSKLKTELREIERNITIEKMGSKDPKGIIAKWWKWILSGFVLLVILCCCFLIFYDQEHISNNNKSFSVLTLPVIKIEDGSKGFVKTKNDKHIFVNMTIGSGAEMYSYANDTLTLMLNKPESVISIYEFHVVAELVNIVESNGELVVYDKPAIQGFYLLMSNEFFKIENTQQPHIFLKASPDENGLLKYYTEK